MSLKSKLIHRLGKVPDCHYCGIELTEKTLTVDHKTAKSAGGQDKLDNLLPACKPCNLLKGNISYDDFINGARKAVPGINVRMKAPRKLRLIVLVPVQPNTPMYWDH